MIDPYVILAPFLLLPVVWLLRFIGCASFTSPPVGPGISGVVTIAGGGALSGVTMTLNGPSTAPATSTTTTDVSGNYSFSDLKSGTFTVTPSLAGYSFSPASATATLGASQTLNFTATPAYKISGQVVLAGAGLKDVQISLSGSKLDSANTDPSGNFSFPGLTPGGNYTVTPTLLGYHFTPPQSNFNNLTMDQSANFIATAAPLVNIAQGKPASQSSTNNAVGGRPDASSAVDGNTDGNFFNNSVTHTNMDANAWWEVDLGASVYVTSITIWNRTDTVPERLSDYWVFASDILYAASDTPATLQGRGGTFSNHQTTYPRPSTTIPVNFTGRYVRVQLSGTNFLSLAEVQVFTYA